MQEIRRGLENKLTEDQVRHYANPEFTCAKMRTMRHLLEDGVQDVELYIDYLLYFNKLGNPMPQSKILAAGAYNGVSMQKLDIIAGGHFSIEQIIFLLCNLQKK